MTQTKEQTTRRVVNRFPRRSSRGRFMGLEDVQLVLMGVGFIALIAGFLGLPWLVSGTVMFLVFALAPTWFSGRPIIRWFPLLGAFVLRAMKGQLKFRKRPTQPRPVGTLGLPGDAARLRVLREEMTGAGLVHDPSSRTLTAILRVRPSESFLLAEGTKQDTMADGWASVLGAFCTDTSGGITRVGVLLRAVSDGGQEITNWYEEHGSPALSIQAHAAYGEYLHHSRTEAMRHEAYLSITLDMTQRSVGSLIREAGGGVLGGSRVLRSRMEYVVTQLPGAALTFERWVSPQDVARLARVAYEPGAQSALEGTEDVGESLPGAGPMAVDEAFTYFRTEGSFHQVLLVSEWPRKETTAGFLQQLVVARVRHSFAMVFEPIAVRKAIKDATRRATEAETTRIWQSKTGGQDAPERKQERTALERERNALESGQGALNFAGLVTVSADSLEELRASTERVKTAGLRSNCELRVLGGQQCSAFVGAALPFGRGL